MPLYLVTGGAGFIGSHLVERLLRQGDQVRVLDDLSTGSLANVPPGVEFIQGDVACAKPVREAMWGVVGCFHLAAVASVEQSNREWVAVHRVNQTGTIQVFSAVRDLSPDAPIPVVYASSAAVYGDNPVMPLTEAMCPTPMTAYGADKLGCELHARAAGLVHKIPSMGLRFFNVYGPRQDLYSPYSGVISMFMERAQRGENLKIFGDGHQVRDFVFVQDVVEMMIRAMARAHMGGVVLNVCTGRATSILELAGLVNRLCGNPLPVVHHPARPGDIRLSMGDPVQGEKILGLRAGVSLEDGLQILLDWRKKEPQTRLTCPG
ncbi:MAG: NAD-dependent epimerase/dehydratase family protein [Magnetococcales bacterium]|nr:NAD-dependent epimerase/dehydratase family protein [Magnetococcales bacterium]